MFSSRFRVLGRAGTPHAARQGSEKLSQQEALATLLVLAVGICTYAVQ